MTKIVCRASDCIFWELGACTSDVITYDPENGCLTYEGLEDILLEDEEAWVDDAILDDDDTLVWNDDDVLLDVDEDDGLLDLDEDEGDEWVL